MNRRREGLARRQFLKSFYSGLYEEVSAILFRHDPIGLNFGHNTNEYEPEVDTILPRLENAYSVQDVRRIVHEEFLRWFSSGTTEDLHGIVGREEHYQAIAADIWEAMSKHGIRQYDDYNA